MPIRHATTVCLLIVCSFLLPLATTAVQPASWLDRNSPNWNTAGGAVPKIQSSFEARCRSVDNRFAGTLTPVPMNSRSDGVESRVWLTSATVISVEFSRYRNSDALCCPSGKSRKSYTITRAAQGALVVPDTAPATTEWQPGQK